MATACVSTAFLLPTGSVCAQVKNLYAYTQAADSIGTSSALLHGNAGSPSAVNVTIGFELWTSATDIQTVPALWSSSTNISGSIHGDIEARVSTLRCGTTYQFKAIIQTLAPKTASGSTLSFSTPSCLPRYNFDDASLNDSSGSGYTLTPGGYSTARPGFSTASPALGDAISGTCGYRTFNRTDQTYLELPGSFPNLGSDGEAFTISAWIRTTDNTVTQRIFVDDYNVSKGYGFSLSDELSKPGMLRFYSRGTSSSITLDTEANLIKNNTWYFVAAVADIPNKKKSIFVFVPAGTQKSVTNIWTDLTFGADTGPATIGGEHVKSKNSPKLPFSGDIDELTLHKGALDETALKKAMTATRACTDVTSQATSTVIASPENVIADGKSTSTLSVTLKTASGIALPGKTVTLVADKGNSVIATLNSVTDASGIARFSVTDSTAETVTYTATNASDTITLTKSAAVAFTDYTLDAVQAGKASGTRLYTKIAQKNFSLDVLALNTSKEILASGIASLVSVDLVDQKGSATGVCGTVSLGCTVTPSSFTYTDKDAGRKTITFNCTTAAPDVRVRLASGNKALCSIDNFAIRPEGFTVTSGASADANGQSTSNTPKIAAGSEFSISAIAILGYSGTPKIQPDLIATPAKTSDIRWKQGTLTGTFKAANIPTGTATASDATYSEVGYFRMTANGIYDDNFTAVDQVSGDLSKSDCTPDYQNEPTNEGKIGCYFGNISETRYFGRFAPHHFTTTVTPGCTKFTYAGQAFTVITEARNRIGDITTNYDGTVNTGFAKATRLTTLNGTSGELENSIITASAFTSGSATTTPMFNFFTSPPPPTFIGLRALESGSDGTSSWKFTEGTAEIRSGRITLSNAIGSELSSLNVPLAVQHFTSKSAWENNTDDTCSILSANNFALNFIGSQLKACDTAISVTGTAPGQALALSAPTDKKTGWATLTLNLSANGVGKTCTEAGKEGPDETPAAKPWLQFNWKGAGPANPSARISFGLKRPGPTVYVRERY